VERLAREIVTCRLPIGANCAARTVDSDVRPIADIAQKTGLPIMAATFLGSSPIRRLAENWTVDFLIETTRKAVRYARSVGVPVMYVTEDTTRCDPQTMKALYNAALDEGAEAVVVCDTVGHATPAGVKALLRYFIDKIISPRAQQVRIDWHGHSDRGLAVANSLAAIEAGADCVHGCALGIGERVGNTPLDQVIVNLRLMGLINRDLSRLRDYCEVVSQATGVPIPVNYPVFGRDAFRTATGVHAAAVVKSFRRKDHELADRIYSGVPAGWFGREQEIEIGPMSGRWNVIFWLERHGLASTDGELEEQVDRILKFAKSSDHVLSNEEVLAAMQA
jgi:2-isopropylmalate synthase